MATRVCLVLCGLLSVSYVVSANAEVITFDELPRPGGTYDIAPIPDGYGGFDWSSTFFYCYTDIDRYRDLGWGTGTVSGKQVAYNYNHTSPVSMSASSLFDFTGAYFTSAEYAGVLLDIDGYQGADLVGTRHLELYADAPTWFDIDLLGVDRVVFTTPVPPDWPTVGGNRHFVMDNLTINESVPEPTSLALWSGLGIMGLVAARRRRRQAA